MPRVKSINSSGFRGDDQRPNASDLRKRRKRPSASLPSPSAHSLYLSVSVLPAYSFNFNQLKLKICANVFLNVFCLIIIAFDIVAVAAACDVAVAATFGVAFMLPVLICAISAELHVRAEQAARYTVYYKCLCRH